MKNEIKVGLCGLGTVGAGVAEMLQKNAGTIRNRTGATISVTRAATIDPYDHLDIDFSNIEVTSNVEDILNDPEIDIVVELIGGTGLAEKIILGAFEKDKSVVTANKALLAKKSREVFTAAYSSKGFFGFEASVGGGIPIIRSIKHGFAGDIIESFSGIVNGTANYILSSMTNEKAGFSEALKAAQEKGFAEADPTFDIEGFDAAHKVIILMELAFNALFSFDDLYIEGISRIESKDIELADQLGYKIKLLGMARQTPKGYEGRVHPALVDKNSMLASVNGAFNAISVHGNFVGHTMHYGAGAGSHPTASAVVGDIIEISHYLAHAGGKQVPPLLVPIERLEMKSILPIDEIESEYFIRIPAHADGFDMNAIKKIFAEKGVEIKQNRSDNSEDASSNLGVLTGLSVEKEVKELVKDLSCLSFVSGPIKLIRVNG